MLLNLRIFWSRGGTIDSPFYYVKHIIAIIMSFIPFLFLACICIYVPVIYTANLVMARLGFVVMKTSGLVCMF